MDSCWPKLRSVDKIDGSQWLLISLGMRWIKPPWALALDFLVQLPGAWKKAYICVSLAPAPLSWRLMCQQLSSFWSQTAFDWKGPWALCLWDIANIPLMRHMAHQTLYHRGRNLENIQWEMKQGMKTQAQAPCWGGLRPLVYRASPIPNLITQANVSSDCPHGGSSSCPGQAVVSGL